MSLTLLSPLEPEVIRPCLGAFPLTWSFSTEGEHSAESTAPAAAGASAATTSVRVLVVEDNQDAAGTLAEFLECLGYEVQVAYTGLDGVALALRYLPHLVLCDLGLPGCDGFEVARVVRSEPVAASARFIAVTGYSSEVDRRHAEEVGFDHFLVKPVDLSHLEGLLAKERALIERQNETHRDVH